MPRRKREIREGPPPPDDKERYPEDTRLVTIVQEWTRQEQIDNADADGTLDEMKPAKRANEDPTPRP